MKNVIIEIDKASNPHSGLGQFCLKLGGEIMSRPKLPYNFLWAVKPSTGKPLGEEAKYFSLKKVDRYVPVKIGKNTLWHCIHQDSPYMPRPKGKFILTIHDLNFLEKYKSDLRKNWRTYLLQKKIDRADVITTISEYSASIIREHLHLHNKPLVVIYNGCNISEASERSTIEPQEPYFFTIGILQRRKNFQSLFPLLKDFPEHRLYIAGPDINHFKNQLLTEATKAGVSDRVIFCGAVDEATKNHLYKHCAAFLFPSLSEGFGLPVIEAMHYGKPIVLSDKTCLPEIGGELTGYWRNFEQEHMREVLQDYLENFSSEKSKALQQRALQFTWSKAADEYLKIYSEL